MSTTVSYKGNTIATLNNETKTLTTAGTWVEGNIIITDSSSGSGNGTAIITDTTDTAGGTIRTITTTDEVHLQTKTITPTSTQQTVLPDTGYDGFSSVIVGASSGGSTPSSTAHEIYFEFSDGTDTTIDVYYDDSLISTMITAYTPTTYGQKTVTLAQLDGVTWYEYDPSETWETLYDGNMNWAPEENGDYPYCWISSLGSTPITVGSVFRVTYNNVEYRCTAKTAPLSGQTYNVFGNPVWGGGTDDGTGVPFVFIDYTIYGAWSGGLNVPNVNSDYYFKIERLVTS